MSQIPIFNKIAGIDRDDVLAFNYWIANKDADKIVDWDYGLGVQKKIERAINTNPNQIYKVKNIWDPEREFIVSAKNIVSRSRGDRPATYRCNTTGGKYRKRSRNSNKSKKPRKKSFGGNKKTKSARKTSKTPKAIPGFVTIRSIKM